MDGATADTFDSSAEQVAWLKAQLFDGRLNGFRPLVFTHLYPSELLTRGETVGHLLRESHVLLVEMGHTHLTSWRMTVTPFTRQLVRQARSKKDHPVSRSPLSMTTS